MDCSLPGSSVHGIFQARVLEWGAIAFSVFCFFFFFVCVCVWYLCAILISGYYWIHRMLTTLSEVQSFSWINTPWIFAVLLLISRAMKMLILTFFFQFFHSFFEGEISPRYVCRNFCWCPVIGILIHMLYNILLLNLLFIQQIFINHLISREFCWALGIQWWTRLLLSMSSWSLHLCGQIGSKKWYYNAVS